MFYLIWASWTNKSKSFFECSRLHVEKPKNVPLPLLLLVRVRVGEWEWVESESWKAKSEKWKVNLDGALSNDLDPQVNCTALSNIIWMHLRSLNANIPISRIMLHARPGFVWLSFGASECLFLIKASQIQELFECSRPHAEKTNLFDWIFWASKNFIFDLSFLNQQKHKRSFPSALSLLGGARKRKSELRGIVSHAD